MAAAAVMMMMMMDDDEDDDDSELGQMLMTCGKPSNQAPSVKSRLSGSHYSSAQ